MREALPEGVRVMDAGIRGRHLAYEILDGGYQDAILVDTVRRGGLPGTLYLIEPDTDASRGADGPAPVDAHAMTPAEVLAFVGAAGGSPARIRILGCEPESIDEGMGLTPAVGAAVEQAVMLLRELVGADGAATASTASEGAYARRRPDVGLD
jgi:hydrogenase maturation protease